MGVSVFRLMPTPVFTLALTRSCPSLRPAATGHAVGQAQQFTAEAPVGDERIRSRQDPGKVDEVLDHDVGLRVPPPQLLGARTAGCHDDQASESFSASIVGIISFAGSLLSTVPWVTRTVRACALRPRLRVPCCRVAAVSAAAVPPPYGSSAPT